MSDNTESRLDRLEALAAEILAGLRETREGIQEERKALRETREGLQQAREGLREAREGIQETREGNQETHQEIQKELRETRAIANSNAKSIEALANSITESKKQWERDRRGLYQLMGQLSRSMSNFYDTQSDYYNRFDQIEERQARMNEILDRLLPPDE